MGCGSSTPAGDAQEQKRNRQISKDLKVSGAVLSDTKNVRLLLLGAGESGKSTVVKQMKILHLHGYTNEERAAFIPVIYSNTIQSMKVLIAAADKFAIDMAEETEDAAIVIEDVRNTKIMTPEIYQAIKLLWHDRGIRRAFSRSAEYQLNDSAGYYFDNLDRLATPDFLPNEQDILRARVRTTGIVETIFDYGGLHFTMIDVGGQRNERRKWISVFNDVTAIIFVAAISEYDQTLFEDDTTNRMIEALNLFRDICNNTVFVKTSQILFLNKTDIFDVKVTKVDMRCCFADYNGGTNVEAARAFVKEKFFSVNRNPAKKIYPHFTCATDTRNVKFVFAAVKEILLRRNLAQIGMDDM